MVERSPHQSFIHHVLITNRARHIDCTILVRRQFYHLKATNFCDLKKWNMAACEVKYEYRDHPADVQLHAWGDTLQEAYEQVATAMYGYMTELDKVDITQTEDIEVEGHDLESLLYQFLDECLFVFSTEPSFLVAKKVEITSFDRDAFKITARLHGESFDISKHPQGTEVKAITYASMEIYDTPGKCEVFVIIDI
ncbi:Archease domain [Trinorchestia longiramus]|nr:Archease domain [Trinorchestia longiramus]